MFESAIYQIIHYPADNLLRKPIALRSAGQRFRISLSFLETAHLTSPNSTLTFASHSLVDSVTTFCFEQLGPSFSCSKVKQSYPPDTLNKYQENRLRYPLDRDLSGEQRQTALFPYKQMVPEAFLRQIFLKKCYLLMFKENDFKVLRKFLLF